MRRGAVPVLLLLAVGCEIQREPHVTLVVARAPSATVESLAEPGSSGVVGAVVGGVLAGPIGAVVGYAADADAPRSAANRITACEVEAALGATRYRLRANRYEYNDERSHCALLREGDRLPGVSTRRGLDVPGYEVAASWETDR